MSWGNERKKFKKFLFFCVFCVYSKVGDDFVEIFLNE
jgi:hypothetical protein